MGGRILIVAILAAAALAAAAGTASAVQAPSLLKKVRISAEVNGGYDRDSFYHWSDADSDSCDTRDEVLFRQNLARPKSCGDDRGRWVSAYDGLRLSDSSDLDVDHMVPLAEAWGSGAKRWTATQREAFANDLYKFSLIAVSASSNRSKSDRDPAEWLPPKKSYTCRYVARWTAVKYRWKLTADGRERRALTRTFKQCPRGALRLPFIARAQVNAAPPGEPEPEPPAPPTGNDPQYSTCKAATAAGYGPYVRGVDPEYYWYRDSDSDGVVCER